MRKGEIIRATFSIFDEDGVKVTGRALEVTTNLQKNNVATAEVITIAESSDVAGDYQASFTPLDGGIGVIYRLDVIDPVYNLQGWTSTWEVLENDVDSINLDLTFLKDIEGGKWQIVSNQMIFYKADNTTEVARFNLFDSNGVAAMINVYRRDRV